MRSHCWCFQCEHVLLHNTLLYVGTGKAGVRKRTQWKLYRNVCTSVYTLSVIVCVCAYVCVSTCVKTGAECWEGAVGGSEKRKPRMDGKTADGQNNLPDSQSCASKLQPIHIRQALSSSHWWGCRMCRPSQAARGHTQHCHTSKLHMLSTFIEQWFSNMCYHSSLECRFPSPQKHCSSCQHAFNYKVYYL